VNRKGKKERAERLFGHHSVTAGKKGKEKKRKKRPINSSEGGGGEEKGHTRKERERKNFVPVYPQ